MNLRRSKRQTERSIKVTRDDNSPLKTLKQSPSTKRLARSPATNKKQAFSGTKYSPKKTKSVVKGHSNEVEANNNNNANLKKLSDPIAYDSPDLANRKRRVTGSDDYIKRKFLYGVTEDAPKKKRNSNVKSTSAIALVAASSTKLHKKQASKIKKSARGNLAKPHNRIQDRTRQLSQSGNESDNMAEPLEAGVVESFLVGEDDDVDAVGLERLLMATQDISASRDNRKLEKRFFQASRKRQHMKHESSDTDMQDQVDSDQSDDFFMHSDPPQTSYSRSRMAALGAATDAALDDLGSDIDMDPAIHQKSGYPYYRPSAGSDDMQEDDNDEDFSGDLLSPNVILNNQNPIPTSSVSTSRRKSPIRPMQVLPLDPNHDNRNRRQNVYRTTSPYNSPHKRRLPNLGYSEGHPISIRSAPVREQNQALPIEPPTGSAGVQSHANNNPSTVNIDADQVNQPTDASAKDAKDKAKATSNSNSGSTSSSNSTSNNTPGNNNKGKAPVPPRYRPSILQRKSGQGQSSSQSTVTTLPSVPMTAISDLPTATVLPSGNVVLTSDPNSSLDTQSVQNSSLRQISSIVTSNITSVNLSLQHPNIGNQQVVYQKSVVRPYTASAKLFGIKPQEVNSVETTHIDSTTQRNANLVTLSSSVQSSGSVSGTIPVVVQPTTTLPYTMVRAGTKGKNIVLLGPQTGNTSMQQGSIIRPTIVRTNARSILRTSAGAVVTPVVSGGPPMTNVTTVSSGQGLIVVRGGDGVTRMLPTCTTAGNDTPEYDDTMEESDFDRALNTPANPVAR